MGRLLKFLFYGYVLFLHAGMVKPMSVSKITTSFEKGDYNHTVDLIRAFRAESNAEILPKTDADLLFLEFQSLRYVYRYAEVLLIAPQVYDQIQNSTVECKRINEYVAGYRRVYQVLDLDVEKAEAFLMPLICPSERKLMLDRFWLTDNWSSATENEMNDKIELLLDDTTLSLQERSHFLHLKAYYNYVRNPNMAQEAIDEVLSYENEVENYFVLDACRIMNGGLAKYDTARIMLEDARIEVENRGSFATAIRANHTLMLKALNANDEDGARTALYNNPSLLARMIMELNKNQLYLVEVYEENAENEKALYQLNTQILKDKHEFQLMFFSLVGFVVLIILLVFYILYLVRSRKLLIQLARKKERGDLIAAQEESGYQHNPTLVHVLENIKNSINDRFYLQKGLTLKDYAASIESNTSYVSKVINTEYDCNFSSFINNLRVDYFIQLIKSGGHQKYTLEHLSSQAGFSSISTFNRTFKQQTGLSPKTYIQEVLEME